MVCPLYSRPTRHFSPRVFHLLLNSSFIKSFSRSFSNYPPEKYSLSLARLKLNLPFYTRRLTQTYIYFLIERLSFVFSVREEGKLFLRNYRIFLRIIILLILNDQMQRRNLATRLYSLKMDFSFTKERDKCVGT